MSPWPTPVPACGPPHPTSLRVTIWFPVTSENVQGSIHTFLPELVTFLLEYSSSKKSNSIHLSL